MAQAIADDLSQAAKALTGELDDGTPIALVRGLRRSQTGNTKYPELRFATAMNERGYLLGFWVRGTCGLEGSVNLRNELS